MDYSADAITLLERLGDLAAHLLNNTSIVAANSVAGVQLGIVNMLPVRGVETDSFDFDEDVIVTKPGQRDVLDGGLSLGLVDNSFGRHGC
jgi:hypothetical protein